MAAGYSVIDPAGADIVDVNGDITHYNQNDIVPLAKLMDRRYGWLVERGYLGETLTGVSADNIDWGEITGTLSNQTDLQNALNLKAPLASPTFTGTPAAPTAAADTNTTQVATTAYVIGQGYLKSSTASSTYAPLASPTFTGTVTLPSVAGTKSVTMGSGYVTIGLVTIGRSGSGYGTIGDGYRTTSTSNQYQYDRAGDYATMLDFASGKFSFRTSPVGTNAGDTVTYTERLAIANTGAITTSGTIAQSNTTESSSSITGAFTTAGGMGIAKKLYVGTDLNVGGSSTFSGNISISKASPELSLLASSGEPYLHLSAPTSANSSVMLETGGSLRWILRKNSTAESGANAGSDFEISRRDDTGGGLGTALTITRSTGLFTITGDIHVSKATPWIKALSTSGAASLQADAPNSSEAQLHLSTSGERRWSIIKNSVAESGSDAGSDFAIYRFSDTDSYLGAPVSISRSTGNITLQNNLGINTAPSYKLHMSGSHTDTQFLMHSTGGSGVEADLMLWASEPYLTYSGAGIGNNIGATTGMNRINTSRGSSYMRLLDNQIAFGLISSAGVATYPATFTSSGATFNGTTHISGLTSDPALGAELAPGSGLGPHVINGLTVGGYYYVTATTLTACTISPADEGGSTSLVVSDNDTAFVANATTHTLTGTGTGNLSVKQITATTYTASLAGQYIRSPGYGSFAVSSSNTGLQYSKKNYNFSLGASSLESNVTGVYNNAFGYGTLRYNVTGDFNSAMGPYGLYNNKSGLSNIGIGYAAGYSNKHGGYNINIGFAAGYYFDGGESNVFIGTNAGYGTGTASVGDYNAFLGYNAGRSFTSGQYNLALGTNAGYTGSTGTISGAVMIGTDDAGTGAQATANNQFVLGTTSHSVQVPGSLTVTGKVSIDAGTAAGTLDLGMGTSGRSIVWGGTSGNGHYTSIWSSYSGAALVLGRGLRGTTATSDGYESSYASSVARHALRMDSTGWSWLYEAAAAKDVGTAITPTSLMSLNNSGNLSIAGALSLSGTSDTATAATHYYVETASDGIVRPKTLANVKSEIVTTAAVNSAAATTVGTVTSGTWQATDISEPYISTAIARLASPTFTGTPEAPTATAGTSTTQLATTDFVRKNWKCTSASTTDSWNTVLDPGLHPVLLYGTATGGPGGGEYYYVTVFQYSSTSQVCQVAFPYSDEKGRIWVRTRYNGVWNTWSLQITNTIQAGAELTRSSNQSISTATWTNITGSDETYDPTASLVHTTGIYTAPTDGLYTMSAHVDHNGTTGSCFLRFVRGGDDYVFASVSLPWLTAFSGSLSTTAYLAADQTVRCQVYHSEAATRSVTNARIAFAKVG